MVSVLGVSELALAAAPDATTRAAARKIATEGVEALERGDASLASQRLEKAFQLLQAPSIALWSARAYVKQGKLVEGAERYTLTGRLPVAEGNDQAVQDQAKTDAMRELSELTPRIPKLIVAIDQSTPVDVTVDGKQLAAALVGEEQLLNPGAHTIVAVRGAERLEENLTLQEGQTRTVALRFQSTVTPLKASKAPEHSAQRQPSEQNSAGAGRTLGYVGIVAGGVGVLTGAITGFVALKKRSELDDNPNCRDGKCLEGARGDVNSFRTMRTVSTASFIAGGVLGGIGIALLLRSGSSEKAASAPAPMALSLHTGGISLEGAF